MEKKTKEMMEQFIAENINRVPRNQSKKFETMTIEQKVERIQMYIDREKMWEEAAQKRAELAEQRKLSNKVKELMTRRHATIQDAQEIITICQEFINNYKDAEMARIDEEIAKLMAMKQSIENN